MASLLKFRHFSFILFSILLLGCKSEKETYSVVGKWNYDHMHYTAANKSWIRLTEEQKKKRQEEDEKEARGTVFYFNQDSTYQVVSPNGKNITGTWRVNEKGDEIELISDGTNRKQTGKLNFADKNNLAMEDEKSGIIVEMKRM